jgi:hypothetical protein
MEKKAPDLHHALLKKFSEHRLEYNVVVAHNAVRRYPYMDLWHQTSVHLRYPQYGARCRIDVGNSAKKLAESSTCHPRVR